MVAASRFKDVRLSCALTVPAAAQLLRVSVRTLQNWEAGRVRIPYAAFKLLRVLRGHELAHPAWRGFRVVGDTLWTPERRSFRPDHLTWWSLTCRMADEFRSIVARRFRPVVASADASAMPAPPLSEPASPPYTGVSREGPRSKSPTPPYTGVSRCARSAGGMTFAPSSNHGVKLQVGLLSQMQQSAGSEKAPAVKS